jgi:lysophospholipase L1-like esterase
VLPDVDLFVAKIIDRPVAQQETRDRVKAYNQLIPGIVQARRNAGHKVHLVDMYSVVKEDATPDDYHADNTHPSVAGYAKMATTWFTAMRATPTSLAPR